MALRVKDIADKLNISPATVSLVLNNKPGVSSETRQRVLKLVEEMGYGTNLLSKPALKNNRNIRFVIYKKHGMVVSDTPFFSALMEGIDQEARSEGYNLIISYMNEKDSSRAETLRILEENPADGLLLLATEMEAEDLAPFLRMETPLLVLDGNFEKAGRDTVLINNRQGAYEATRYLIEAGHTEIGCLASSVWIRNFDERREGFLEALDECGMKPDKRFMLSLESTMEGACRDMRRIIASGAVLPTAFFADNDLIAFGAIKALKESGIKVPERVSIVGFDDMPFCDMIEPALTTIRVFKERMGRIAVKRLIERIGSDMEESIKIEVGTQLVERKSVFRLKP